jgi:hypothetical protein
MAYYIGSTTTSAGSFNWTASMPSTASATQQEMIEMACAGYPVDYSDNYFTVTSASQPVCDKPAVVSFADTSTPSIYPGQSISNQLVVTNPNDPSCGSTLYGLSNSYPFGWTMDVPYSVSVTGGSTVNVPVTLTSSTDAAYQTYSYRIDVGDSNGGITQNATGYVNVVPDCRATVQASLAQSSQNAPAGSTINNTLILTNPNPSACGAKTYVYSWQTPAGWNIGIQPATVNSGETVSVPFTVAVDSSASVGSYGYKLSVYNEWADGSGQAQVAGTINVIDTQAPTISISSPTNGSMVPARSSVTVSADATDNVKVSRVEFYVNGALICTDTSASYTCTFNTGKDKGDVYTITVKAYDPSDNVSTTSVEVTTAAPGRSR